MKVARERKGGWRTALLPAHVQPAGTGPATQPSYCRFFRCSAIVAPMPVPSV
jgi:hypothetical protein